MCSQYIVKLGKKTVLLPLGLEVDTDKIKFTERVFPHLPAPVIAGREVRLMSYSLVPSWSAARKPKFATYNARIETVTEKATWKKPFQEKHCVVPLTSFIESVYEGPLAGNMIKFATGDVLYAAGIFDQWVDRSTGEVVDSFAILTTAPSDFILKYGHDRQPIFLDGPDAVTWLDMKNKQPEEMKSFLLNHTSDSQYVVEADRPLKSKKA